MRRELHGRTRLFIFLAVGGFVAAQAREALAQQIYRELTYDSHGSLVQSKGPVYGPNPDQNELQALTRTWTYQYPQGYVLLTGETGPQGHSVSYQHNSAYDMTQISRQGGALVDSFGYDSSGRPTSRTRTNGQQTVTWATQYVSGTCTRWTDPRGNLTEAHFDSFGRVVMEVGPASTVAELQSLISAGSVRTIAYDSAGRPTSAINEVGAVSSWAYDSAGRLVAETSPAGLVSAYAYDSQGRLSTVTYPATPPGLANLYYAYDSSGRVLHAGRRSDAQTVVYEGYVRDAAGNVTHVVGPAYSTTSVLGMISAQTNVMVQYVYDALGRRVGQTQADGETRAWTYDARGNVTTETSNAGFTAQSRFDYLDRLTARVAGAGTTTTFAYDGLGRVVQEVGPWADADADDVADDADTASVKQFQHDVNGSVVWSQVDSLPATTISYDYDLPTTVQSGGKTWTLQWDAARRLVFSSEPRGVSESRQYDAAGALTRRTIAPGTSNEVRTDYAYDGAGRPASVVQYPTPQSTNGAVTTTLTYDASGRLSGGVRPDGVTWNIAYDLLGNVVSDQNVGGVATTRTFSATGLPVTVTPHGGPTVAYAYDAAGRLTSVTEGGLRSWTYAYDSVGRPASVTYPDGTTTTYAYDARGRIASETTNAGAYVRTYSYDARSRVAQLGDGTSSYAYAYDAYDRIVGVTDQSARTTSYAYTPAGSLASESRPAGDTLSYAYDQAGRLTGIQRTSAGAGGPVASITYDAIGRIQTWTYANNCVESTTYDGMGRTAGVVLSAFVGGPVLESQSASYDGMSRLTSIARPNGDVESFSYDSDGQLTGATRVGPTPYAAAFSYDGAGNLVGENFNGVVTSYARGSLGQLMSKTSPAGTTTLAYDAGGRLLTRADPAGVTTYAYDVRGRMTSVSSTATAQSATFGYDVLSRRATKTTAAGIESYVFTPDGRRAETYLNGALLEAAFCGEGCAAIESWRPNGSARSYFESLSGNVDRVLDQTGATVAQTAYDPFGGVIAGGPGPGTGVSGTDHGRRVRRRGQPGARLLERRSRVHEPGPAPAALGPRHVPADGQRPGERPGPDGTLRLRRIHGGSGTRLVADGAAGREPRAREHRRRRDEVRVLDREVRLLRSARRGGRAVLEGPFEGLRHGVREEDLRLQGHDQDLGSEVGPPDSGRGRQGLSADARPQQAAHTPGLLHRRQGPRDVGLARDRPRDALQVLLQGLLGQGEVLAGRRRQRTQVPQEGGAGGEGQGEGEVDRPVERAQGRDAGGREIQGDGQPPGELPLDAVHEEQEPPAGRRRDRGEAVAGGFAGLRGRSEGPRRQGGAAAVREPHLCEEPRRRGRNEVRRHRREGVPRLRSLIVGVRVSRPAVVSAAAAALLAGCGDPPPAPHPDLPVQVERDADLRTRVLLPPPEDDGCRDRVFAAPWPCSTWTCVAEGALGGRWADLSIAPGFDGAVRAERTQSGGVRRSTIRFVGAPARRQAAAEAPEDLRVGLGAGFELRPRDGALIFSTSFLGTPVRLRHESSPASTLGRDAWAHSFGERLLDTFPPCLILPTGEIVATRATSASPDRTEACLYGAVPTERRLFEAERVRRTDGTALTTVTMPGLILTFDGPDWGAGGELTPSSIRAVGTASWNGAPWTRSQATTDECVLSRGADPALHVVDAPGDDERLTVWIDGGAEWRLRRSGSTADGACEATLTGALERGGPPGLTRSIAYDSSGRLIESRTASDAPTRFEYDERGRIESALLPTGARWTIRYLDADAVRVVTDGGGSTTRYAFAGGLCVSIELDGESILTRTLDADGRVSREVRRGHERTFEYLTDGAFRILEKEGPR